jgi:hypothetical protein
MKTGPTGFEPATSAVTGRCSNRLNYGPRLNSMEGALPTRVTFAARATWLVSTAAMPSVNTLVGTPTFSELPPVICHWRVWTTQPLQWPKTSPNAWSMRYGTVQSMDGHTPPWRGDQTHSTKGAEANKKNPPSARRMKDEAKPKMRLRDGIQLVRSNALDSLEP